MEFLAEGKLSSISEVIVLDVITYQVRGMKPEVIQNCFRKAYFFTSRAADLEINEIISVLEAYPEYASIDIHD